MDGVVTAVDGISFSMRSGESLGIVGESGSGKSATALSLMRLLQTPPAEISGEIWFDGQQVLALNEEGVRRLRGVSMAMIFQEPMTSLNPVLKVGDQISEAALAHGGVSRKGAKKRALEMLELVGIPDHRRRMDQYPHELSGGMRQRVMIAIALACSPKLLIADEPTTALDVTIQAQILDLIARLQRETGTALLLITHDFGVVAQVVQRVAVMYAGKLVEIGPVEDVLQRPKHPYTQGLLAAVPARARKGERLSVISGSVPNPFAMPVGCRFQPRCPFAFEPCATEEPPLAAVERDRSAACWLHINHRPAR
jgi:oligopeptide/dipeptide ABC transporter ATP-binding protein